MNDIKTLQGINERPSQRVSGGGRRLSDMPQRLVEALSSGKQSTKTWTEWMAVDTGRLAKAVASDLPASAVRDALYEASARVKGKGILARLATMGSTIASCTSGPSDTMFQRIAEHPSDCVRQWCAYAVNAPLHRLSLRERLYATIRFAADDNMTVRECAWMAFRPHLLVRLPEALRLLTPLAEDPDPRIRRFAVEVCRPRSVWGQHSTILKAHPEYARELLDRVRQEPMRYPQLAVGNWLNDASKSRPDWVLALCKEWTAQQNPATTSIIRRGLRSLDHLRDKERSELGLSGIAISARCEVQNG
jgi:3-methyladenine DNA glycosylase AlkC